MNESVYIELHPSALYAIDKVCDRFNANNNTEYTRSSIIVYLMQEIESILISVKFKGIVGDDNASED